MLVTRQVIIRDKFTDIEPIRRQNYVIKHKDFPFMVVSSYYLNLNDEDMPNEDKEGLVWLSAEIKCKEPIGFGVYAIEELCYFLTHPDVEIWKSAVNLTQENLAEFCTKLYEEIETDKQLQTIKPLGQC